MSSDQTPSGSSPAISTTPAHVGNGNGSNEQNSSPQPAPPAVAHNAQPQASAPDSDPSKPLAPADLAVIARFPRNKISRLDPELRETINWMLRARVPYREILPQLGEPGKHLNKNNLYRWKKTGYLPWLQEQQKREDARAQLQLLLDLVRENDNGTIHEAAQQLAALKICYALADIDLSALKQTLQQDPGAFLRLVQALPKLSQGGMACEHLRLQLAERKIEVQTANAPSRPRVATKEEILQIARDVHLI